MSNSRIRTGKKTEEYLRIRRAAYCPHCRVAKGQKCIAREPRTIGAYIHRLDYPHRQRKELAEKLLAEVPDPPTT